MRNTKQVEVISEGEEGFLTLIFELEETVTPSIGGMLSSSFETVELVEIMDQDGGEVRLDERTKQKFFEKFKYEAEEAAMRGV